VPHEGSNPLLGYLERLGTRAGSSANERETEAICE
jgi:hypothetical protein